MTRPTYGGRAVSLWAVVLTSTNGTRWVSLVHTEFEIAEQWRNGMEEDLPSLTVTTVPAQYCNGALDTEFEAAAAHPGSVQEARHMVELRRMA